MQSGAREGSRAELPPRCLSHPSLIRGPGAVHAVPASRRWQCTAGTLSTRQPTTAGGAPRWRVSVHCCCMAACAVPCCAVALQAPARGRSHRRRTGSTALGQAGPPASGNRRCGRLCPVQPRAVGAALRALRTLGGAAREQLFVSTKAGYPPGWLHRAGCRCPLAVAAAGAAVQAALPVPLVASPLAP